MHELVTRICKGEGRDGDLEKLQDLAETIAESALWRLGKSAPNPVLSTLKYFRHEFEPTFTTGNARPGSAAGWPGPPVSKGGPAGIDVPSYVALIGEGHMNRPWKSSGPTTPSFSLWPPVQPWL